MSLDPRSIVGRASCVALTLAAALLAGCGTSSLPTHPTLPPLSRVTMAPKVVVLRVGGTQVFTAAAYDTNGVAVPGAGFAWSSTDLGVCRVTNTGAVTATGEGPALIIATAGGKADTAQVFVNSTLSGWYIQTSHATSNLNGVCFLSDQHTGFAVGDLGTMVKTVDAGATWSTQNSGTSSALNSVWFSSTTTGWAVGTGGTLMKSANGGATWSRQVNLFTSVSLNCVRFVDDRHGWIVGASGFTARTVDGGTTWTSHQWDAQPFYGVSFSDTLDGWAVGAGIVYGSHDGGVSWYKLQPSLTAQVLHSVSRVSSTAAWAVGAQGTVISTSATTDSLAWSLASVGSDYQLTGIQMTDATNGWAVGSSTAGGAILVTHDAGTTWTPQASGTFQGLNGVYFVGLRGWAVGAQGRIVHTSTGGE